MNILIPEEKLRNALDMAFINGEIAGNDAARNIFQGKGEPRTAEEIDLQIQTSSLELLKNLKQ